MRRPLAAIAVLALTAALAACGSDKKDTGKKPAGTTATQAKQGTTAAAAPSPAGEKRCVKESEPKPKGPQHLPKPKLKLDPDKTYQAVMVTSCGNFTITLDVKQAPKTSASFAYLAKRGFYDDTIFHRIVPNFVIQGGDPQGTGTGGPGYKVVEAPPDGIRYRKGVVAMAKTEIEDPGTSGSQFYV